ncbi:phage tail assembly chaperone [Cupriavidus basilensis]|uniref:phage tail assembly chaperone n=1 Tax=Cupriavidus basilensis TaxID=68895 RepID=UPI0039F686FE
MSFKVQPNPTFVAEAKIQVPGEGPKPLKLVFKHKTEAEARDFYDRASKSTEKVAVQLLEIVDGWTGVDADFSLATFEQLLANYHGSATAIFDAYFEGLNGARRGN